MLSDCKNDGDQGKTTPAPKRFGAEGPKEGEVVGCDSLKVQ
jgi:hypothetical protein